MKIRYNKCCITKVKELILLKVIKVKNAWFSTIGFNHGFKFKDSISRGYHDLTMLSFNISEITIMAVKNVDYPFIIQNISKSEAIKTLEIAELEMYSWSI